MLGRHGRVRAEGVCAGHVRRARRLAAVARALVARAKRVGGPRGARSGAGRSEKSLALRTFKCETRMDLARFATASTRYGCPEGLFEKARAVVETLTATVHSNNLTGFAQRTRTDT